jgi:putative spermidine/putrescine transport system substrate-binding protein
MQRRRTAVRAALAAASLALVSACGGSSDGGPSGSGDNAPDVPDVPMMQSLGDGEGALNIIVWAGYAEEGKTDPKVDWVTPFEKETGCATRVKQGNTSDEMVQLMKTGQYDGVSASGDATLRLIYGGDVAPVNTDLVPNYATIQPFLKDRAWNSVDGQMYGVPHGWGANLLMWNTDVVKEAPDSWGVVFDENSPYKGKVTAYDSPIYIADAALYLMKHEPDLGIKDPYALDQEQFDAAVDLLKKQRTIIGEYWADATKDIQTFESGDSVLGTTWQYQANVIAADKKVSVDTTLPSEGATGWSDTWMVSAEAEHPVCMYKWMDWITSPEVNAEVAEWFGEAPAQSKSCEFTVDPKHCDTFSADDPAFAEQIHYWTTPTASCLDGRGNICIDYTKWTQAWTSIKG